MGQGQSGWEGGLLALILTTQAPLVGTVPCACRCPGLRGGQLRDTRATQTLQLCTKCPLLGLHIAWPSTTVRGPVPAGLTEDLSVVTDTPSSAPRNTQALGPSPSTGACLCLLTSLALWQLTVISIDPMASSPGSSASPSTAGACLPVSGHSTYQNTGLPTPLPPTQATAGSAWLLSQVRAPGPNPPSLPAACSSSAGY